MKTRDRRGDRADAWVGTWHGRDGRLDGWRRICVIVREEIYTNKTKELGGVTKNNTF